MSRIPIKYANSVRDGLDIQRRANVVQIRRNELVAISKRRYHWFTACLWGNSPRRATVRGPGDLRAMLWKYTNYLGVYFSRFPAPLRPIGENEFIKDDFYGLMLDTKNKMGLTARWLAQLDMEIEVRTQLLEHGAANTHQRSNNMEELLHQLLLEMGGARKEFLHRQILFRTLQENAHGE